MDYKEAIEKSPRGTAKRVHREKDHIKVIVYYHKNGDTFSEYLVNDKIDYFLSRPAADFELEGFEDWEPLDS